MDGKEEPESCLSVLDVLQHSASSLSQAVEHTSLYSWPTHYTCSTMITVSESNFCTHLFLYSYIHYWTTSDHI